MQEKILEGEVVRCHMTAKCRSVVKPDIVFFGEDLSEEFYKFRHDFDKCDLLIIMGTSLTVRLKILFKKKKLSLATRCLLNLKSRYKGLKFEKYVFNFILNFC